MFISINFEIKNPIRNWLPSVHPQPIGGQKSEDWYKRRKSFGLSSNHFPSLLSTDSFHNNQIE